MEILAKEISQISQSERSRRVRRFLLFNSKFQSNFRQYFFCVRVCCDKLENREGEVGYARCTIRWIYMFSGRDNSDPNLLSVNWIDPIIPLTYICILLSESIARNGFVQLDTSSVNSADDSIEPSSLELDWFNPFLRKWPLSWVVEMLFWKFFGRWNSSEDEFDLWGEDEG